CRRYDVNKSGVNDKKSGFLEKKSPPSRGEALYKSAPCRGIANKESELLEGQKSANNLKNAHLEPELENSSYRSHDSSLAANEETFNDIAVGGV
ncbi:MAG: hypothetical protein PHV05_03490, partial [Candidatus Riflebacteria bacterium]|nr:hypothetical protein [Candidatus Riflebacteria bacterium]